MRTPALVNQVEKRSRFWTRNISITKPTGLALYLLL